ncbi:MAG: alanine--tRNA ligase [Ruminococcaceae bacterium]|nr:alanine--tRNA ligase [Oscillospiraceae bacterium]
MEWTSLNELREKYLSFFESKGHLRLKSFPLVPNNDKSLLLINSGMAPMKKYFTGEVTPPRTRVTTCQKCIRTPDLERVGKTARHGTYFEMLGNFSFGDYFKDEAIPWAWEFLTKTLEIPEELLWPSVYESDDEAYNIWLNVIGVPAERIVKLGKADNFWEHGTGPCGPCSEIYFDRGEKYGCGSPDCKPGCDCDRYMEIWNNVFTQFNNMGDGTYEELEHKNIDTGMGLERLACVMQGVDNMFEVDTVRNILNKVCEIAGCEYGKDDKVDVSVRAVTDHIRASTFMICDGVIPSNEGRGYVLRRLLRRAARHGRLLGIKRAFLCELCDTVIAENKSAYPELVEKCNLIKKVISFEEEAFSKTIDQGLSLLANLQKEGETLAAEDAFRLYDTYGFPFDLTKDILEENGMAVDEEGFNRLMDEQRSRSRNARKASDGESWKSDGIAFDDVAATEFLGYTADTCEATVLAIVADGEKAELMGEGQSGVIVLDKTVFYGEGGGQVGDTGVITSGNASFAVKNTEKNGSGVYTHIGSISGGMISVGDKVEVSIDSARRAAIRRNHTAAHLLQAALRSVLGNHVEQAGQLVNDRAVRFDFTHFSALSAEEIAAVEKYVNDAILAGIEVDNREMPIDEAKAMGAMALFGEKYGDVVRVVKAGDRSVELCGGTHVDNTAKIGLFKIVSESSVASGVRRIEGNTGFGVLEMINKYIALAEETAAALKAGNLWNNADRARQLGAELKEKTQVISKLEAQLAAGKTAALLDNAKAIGNVKLVSAVLEGATSDDVKNMCEQVKAKMPESVSVFAAKQGEKLTFCVACGADAVKCGAHAGNLVREVAKIAGGNGGGRPDFAMAGGKQADKASDAVAAAEELLAAQIGG